MEIILIASDHAGFSLKERIKPFLPKHGLEVKDLGTYSKERCDYPDYAALLAKEISAGKYRRGILICKSGIGSSIVANRFSGVRAALCYNPLAARLSREHNDSNILVLGSAFTNVKSAGRILNIWLKAEFTGGRHRRRLNKIRKIEQEAVSC
jgi:ribose 5-phosphate isomerase B